MRALVLIVASLVGACGTDEPVGLQLVCSAELDQCPHLAEVHAALQAFAVEFVGFNADAPLRVEWRAPDAEFEIFRTGRTNKGFFRPVPYESVGTTSWIVFTHEITHAHLWRTYREDTYDHTGVWDQSVWDSMARAHTRIRQDVLGLP